MDYKVFDSSVFDQNDVAELTKYFEDDIAKYVAEHRKQIEKFVERSNKRIAKIAIYNANKDYKILGRTYKSGRSKCIMLIKRYPDGTQQEENYCFDKISQLRSEMVVLKEKHIGVDWSCFEEEIK